MPTFYERIQESVCKFPNNVALEIQRAQSVERVTFAELGHMAESVGSWLSTRVPSDARIAILAANHPRWVAAYLGTIAAGRTAVPLDTAFHADQVKKLLANSGASLLFCDIKNLPVAAAAVEGTQVRLVMTSATSELAGASESAVTTVRESNPQTGAPQEKCNDWKAYVRRKFNRELAGDLDSIFAAGSGCIRSGCPER